MKYLFHGMFLFLFSVLQPTLPQNLEIFGAKPNMFLIYVLVVSFYCSRKEGMTVGFVFGFVLDLLVGRVLGLNAVLMLMLSYFISSFCEKVISQNNLLIVVGIGLVVTFFYEFIYYIVAYLGDLELKTALVRTLLPEALCNVIFSVFVYLIVKKASKKLWDNMGEGIG